MSTTFYVDLKTAIRTKVETDIVTALSLPVQYDNDKGFAQPEASAWCRMTIRPGDTIRVENATPGSGRHRVFGVVIFQVFTPLETGMNENDQFCDGIKNAFIGENVGSATFRTPRVVNVGRGDGKFHQQNVECAFYADDFAA